MSSTEFELQLVTDNSNPDQPPPRLPGNGAHAQASSFKVALSRSAHLRVLYPLKGTFGRVLRKSKPLGGIDNNDSKYG
jgi:hypothetical protein